MKGFELDEKGDVIINKDISMIDGKNLIRQTVETVLGTNWGEWFLNKKEGINYREILTKNPNFDLIRTHVQNGLLQVDDSLWITEYNQSLENRHLKISFTAKNDDNETISAEYSF